jgi:hypothetical protein
MPEYVLGHHLKGEGKRLALMSELLDPMHRRYLQSLDEVEVQLWLQLAEHKADKLVAEQWGSIHKLAFAY